MSHHTGMGTLERTNSWRTEARNFKIAIPVVVVALFNFVLRQRVEIRDRRGLRP